MNRVMKNEFMPVVINRIKNIALNWSFDGRMNLKNIQLLEASKWNLVRYCCILMLTRDVGLHSCGWFKNPDYERCWHLSLSFYDSETKESSPKNKKHTQEIINFIFPNTGNLLWCEPPYTNDGKKNDVWHYRLFCDENWQPILPRGEVYSKEFTEKNWKSFSELKDSE